MENELIKSAVAGKYGTEVKTMARKWAIRELLNNNSIPLTYSELLEAFPNFDKCFAEAFIEQKNWKTLETITHHYDISQDKNLAVVKIVLEVCANCDTNKHIWENWVNFKTSDPRVIEVIIQKALDYPELLNLATYYVKKFPAIENSCELIDEVKKYCVHHPDFAHQGILLIAYLINLRNMFNGSELLTTANNLAEIKAIPDLSSEDSLALDGAFHTLFCNMKSAELNRFMSEGKISPTFQLKIANCLISRNYWNSQFLTTISNVVNLAYIENPNNAELVNEWRRFVNFAATKKENASELFVKLTSFIATYVEKMNWEIALLDWLPGINFNKYAPDFSQMTIQSLDLALQSNSFHPKAFVTALNVWAFDDSNVFDDDWFKNYVAKLPQNADTCLSWQDNCPSLLWHILNLRRYRREWLNKDDSFIVEQAKVFVKMIIQNYSLGLFELTQIRDFCKKMKFDVENEIVAMDQRGYQMAQNRQREKEELIKFFA